MKLGGQLLRRSFRHRNYRLFFLGQGVSLIGTWLTRVALGWWVYRLTGSELMLGAVAFAGQIPTFLLAPLGGVLSDRYDRHRMLVVTQALGMLQSGLLALLAMSTWARIEYILLLAAFQGVINAFDTPARQAFLVEIVEAREDLPNAIALNSSMVNGARLIGPSFAGLLIALFGEAGCFAIDAVTYVAVLGSLLLTVAGVLGGTNSLHTDAYDEALALPTEEAATLALRTQQVIAEETGVPNTVDPLAGSYYLEWLTNEMERRTLDYFEQIDGLGGVEDAIEEGFFAREIGDASWKAQREVDDKRRLVVGVNAYVQDHPEVPIQLVDPSVVEVQHQRLARVRRERDAQEAEAALAELRSAAQDGRNTMPSFMRCAHAMCTLGEQMDVLREVYGVYQEPVLI